MREAVDSQALAARYIRPSGSPKVRFLLLVGSLSLFGPLCIDMYLPALPKISENLHASASAIQLSLTMCLIGLAAGQIIYGVISDSLGRRGPLLAGLTLFIVASLCCATAHSATMLASFRLLPGTRRGGWNRDRPGNRPRPLRGLPSGPGLFALDVGDRLRTGARAADRR